MNAALPLGPITFTCSGQPAGTNCQFSAPPPTPGSGNVLMTIQTFQNTASLTVPPGGSGMAPLYAALFVPVLGLVAAGLSKKNRKKTNLRLALALSALAVTMALAGCGGRHDNGTIPGTYHITVTATTASAQATSNVTLELRHR